jgi:hypothetical protein
VEQERVIYQYDINSAYATVYRDLPCLLHGTWEPIKRLPTTGLYLADCTFRHSRKFHWCTLPIRTDKGTIIFPRQGRGIYWSTELDIARKYGVKLTCHGGWRYIPHCDCVAIDFVEDMYHERTKLGKDGKGMVLKIVLASIYGKLAQSVGCAPYSNPVWAGLIVSTCRSQLVDAALSVRLGSAVHMLATDGLFTSELIPHLPLGTALGEWTLTEHADIFIVQSGVYFLPNVMPKTRGVPQSRVITHEADFRDSWRRYLAGKDLDSVSIELHNFTGLRLALARNKPWRAGQWDDVTKEISFDWSSKRSNPTRQGHSIVTEPLEGSPGLESMPYSRVIGGLNASHRLQFEDQPDWGDQL